MYDRICTNAECKIELIDCWEPITAPEVNCEKCGKITERAWLTKPAAVIQDSIEGGIWIRHGICNPDGSPKKYYSKSEMRKAAEAKGLVNRVEHTTAPGTDKNRHTTKWT